MRSELRIAICRINHETNSFATTEVNLPDFEKAGGIRMDEEVLSAKGRTNEIPGFLNVIGGAGAAQNIEVVPLIDTSSLAGGNLAAEAVHYFEETLRRKLREAGELDGICFALHGANTSAQIPDVDGYLLEVVRQEKGEAVPVAVALDCHAVITQKMVDLASVICGYHTTPHIDIVQTGERTAHILLRMLAGEINPVMYWERVPMLAPPPDGGMNSGPLKEVFDHAARFREIDGVVD